MTTYNGHKNWNYWNVALWIANDESLYRLALGCMDKYKNIRYAVEAFMLYLPETHTPDGAKYNKSNVTAALKTLK